MNAEELKKGCGKDLKRIDGDAQSIAEFGIDLILDNIDKKIKQLQKEIGGDEE